MPSACVGLAAKASYVQPTCAEGSAKEHLVPAVGVHSRRHAKNSYLSSPHQDPLIFPNLR